MGSLLFISIIRINHMEHALNSLYSLDGTGLGLTRSEQLMLEWKGCLRAWAFQTG